MITDLYYIDTYVLTKSFLLPYICFSVTSFSISDVNGKRGLSYRDFINLPKTHAHCTKVNTVNRLWYYCLVCNRNVPIGKNRPFTIGCWGDYNKSPEHHEHIRRLSEVKCLALKEKTKVKQLNSLEKATMSQLCKQQAPLANYFQSSAKKRKAKTLSVTDSAAAAIAIASKIVWTLT